MAMDNLTDSAKRLLASLPRELWTESEDGQALLYLANHGECKYTRMNATLGRFDPITALYCTLDESEIEQIARVIWVGWDDEWTDLQKEIHCAAARLHAMGYRKMSPAVVKEPE